MKNFCWEDWDYTDNVIYLDDGTEAYTIIKLDCSGNSIPVNYVFQNGKTYTTDWKEVENIISLLEK